MLFQFYFLLSAHTRAMGLTCAEKKDVGQEKGLAAVWIALRDTPWLHQAGLRTHEGGYAYRLPVSKHSGM